MGHFFLVSVEPFPPSRLIFHFCRPYKAHSTLLRVSQKTTLHCCVSLCPGTSLVMWVGDVYCATVRYKRPVRSEVSAFLLSCWPLCRWNWFCHYTKCPFEGPLFFFLSFILVLRSVRPSPRDFMNSRLVGAQGTPMELADGHGDWLTSRSGGMWIEEGQSLFSSCFKYFILLMSLRSQNQLHWLSISQKTPVFVPGNEGLLDYKSIQSLSNKTPKTKQHILIRLSWELLNHLIQANYASNFHQYIIISRFHINTYRPFNPNA